MIAKTPDYIIAECGRPQWATTTSDRKTNKEEFSLFKSFEIISNEANKRLLPLRETLTDYYAQVVAAKLEAWNKTTSKTKNKQEIDRQQQQQQQRQQQQKQQKQAKPQKQQHQRPQEQDGGDPAQLKQLKMQRNEVIKKKWQQNGHRDRHQSEQRHYHQSSCEHNHHHHHHYLHSRQGECNRDRPNHFETRERRQCKKTNGIKQKTLRKTTTTTKATLDSDLDVF